MTTMKRNTVEEILDNLKANGWRCIDNHDDEELQLGGIFELVDGSVVQYIDGTRYQSLNGLYISDDDGRVHCSQASVGGVIEGCDINRYNHSLMWYRTQIAHAYFADDREVPFTVRTKEEIEAWKKELH